MLFKKFFKPNFIAVIFCVLVVVLSIVANTKSMDINEDISVANLTVSGNATTTGAHYVGGNLTVIGNASTTGTFTLSGLATFLSGLSIAGNTTSTGNLNIGGTLSVTGTSTLTSVVSNSLATPANYVVFLSGGTTYVRDGLDGSIDYSNTDPETAIEWAMNNLTSGRTWKEKVVVKGNYTIDTSIDIPSYTILELQGRLTIASGTFGLVNSDTTNGNTDIEIIGGTIDGNYANLINYNNCVFLQNSNNLIITGMTIYGCKNEGIEFRNVSGFDISENTIFNNGDDSISLINGGGGGSNNGTVSNNILFGNRSATGGSSGIEIEDGSYEITVSNNVIYGSTASSSMTGIGVVVDSGSTYSASHDVTISGNVIRDVEVSGIIVQTNLTAANLENVTIIGNTIVNSVGSGIQILGKSTFSGISRGVSIIGNTVTQAGTNTAAIYGIYVSYTQGVTIRGNIISESGNNGIRLYYVRQANVSGNIIFNNGNYANSYGINVNTANSQDILISENHIFDTQATKTQDGIAVNAATTRITIINNNLTSVAATAISLQSSGLAYIANNLGYTKTSALASNATSTPQTATLDPSTDYFRYICSDPHTCDITLAESIALEGRRIIITNSGAYACDFANQTDILVIAGGAFAMGTNDVLELVYQSGQWVETRRSNN
ncbi:MAG: right-handed parallel beta-helix repeat-containing protein [Patescibacteria group bacterium]